MKSCDRYPSLFCCIALRAKLFIRLIVRIFAFAHTLGSHDLSTHLAGHELFSHDRYRDSTLNSRSNWKARARVRMRLSGNRRLELALKMSRALHAQLAWLEFSDLDSTSRSRATSNSSSKFEFAIEPEDDQ